jgi:biopolymer transport protein ExbD
MRFRRRLAADTNLNLVPMIDVVFQLIIFFMVATTIIITPGIALVLPSSATAEPTAMSRLVVTVVSREEVYINKERYNMRSLNARLAGVTAKERVEIKSVVLDGDRSISYSLLVEVLDALRRNGFKAINLRMIPLRTP